MSKVAIIYPYFRTNSTNEMLFPPLGAAFLAAQMRKLEINVKIIDCTFLDYSQVQKEIISYNPDIVGIYAMITMTKNAMRIAEIVRSNLPKCLLVAGGPMPTLYPENFSPIFDIVFRGEADLSFPQFCQDFFEKGASRDNLSQLNLENYAGLFIKSAESQINIPTIHTSEKEIACFPLPDRSDFDHLAYQEVWLKKNHTKTTSIITTFGCPFNCDFCSRPIFGNTFRRRKIKNVMEEITEIIHLGYDSLWIADDNFTLNPQHLRMFCIQIKDLHISWSCLSRSTGIDSSMADLMKESGCKRVYLGLESGSQTTLDLMHKQASVEEGIQTVNMFHKSGIEVAAFFIVGYPGETIDSIEETFRIATLLPLDEVSFNVPFPLPGSNLYKKVNGLDPTLDWAEENEVTFVYKSDFDPNWLKRRIQETMQVIKERK